MQLHRNGWISGKVESLESIPPHGAGLILWLYGGHFSDSNCNPMKALVMLDHTAWTVIRGNAEVTWVFCMHEGMFMRAKKLTQCIFWNTHAHVHTANTHVHAHIRTQTHREHTHTNTHTHTHTHTHWHNMEHVDSDLVLMLGTLKDKNNLLSMHTHTHTHTIATISGRLN